MTVDLSFIHDPDWREERERQWAEYEVKESDHYTKRQLECRKRYFMDAELLCQDNEKHRIRDGALLTMYPLKTPEAWEYICRELMQGIRAPGERGGDIIHSFMVLWKALLARWVEAGVIMSSVYYSNGCWEILFGG